MMSGPRIEVNDQKGTFIDLIFNDEVLGSGLATSSATDEQLHSFLTAININRVPGKRCGIICAIRQGQAGLIEKINKQLEKAEFKQLKAFITIFPLTIEPQNQWGQVKQITQIEQFLDEDNEHVIFGPSAKTLSPSVIGGITDSQVESKSEAFIKQAILKSRGRHRCTEVTIQRENPSDSSTSTNLPIQPGSSTAHVLAGTNHQSATPSAVVPSDPTKEVDFIKALSKIETKINMGGVAYELKVDEGARAGKASTVKVEMYKQGQPQALGSFMVSKNKITAHKMTVEIAFAMMKAYMDANSGQPMAIKPKDKEAHQFFVAAAEKLKSELDKISYTIEGVDGADKVDVRLGKVVTSKVAAPSNPSPSIPVTPVASTPPVAAVPSGSSASSVPKPEQPVDESVPLPTPTSSPRSQAHSLPDGNCSFNSFALGLLDIQSDNLPVSTTLKDFMAENKATFALADPVAFQRKMAAILREKAVTLAHQHAVINKDALTQPFLEAFDRYSGGKNENIDEDLFLQHQFIKDKFTEKDLQHHDLVTWWLREGYDLFLVAMKEDKKWAGDLELAELANYFEVNLNIVGSDDVPVSHLYAAKLSSTANTKLSEQEMSQLLELGVVRDSMEFNRVPLALTASQLQARVEAMTTILNNIKNKDISPFDNEIVVLGIYSKDNDGNIIKRLDELDTKRLLNLYRKILPQLEKFKDAIDKMPTISLKHSGSHWDLAETLDKKAAASPRR